MNNAEFIRAKEYALRSLTCHDQTEWEMRKKLKQRGYGNEITDAVIILLQDYNYINDTRYTENFIATHCNRWNRRKLLERLYAKGIHADDDVEIYLEQYQYNEESLLIKEMNKYIKNKDLSDAGTRKKVIAFFMQKGYPYSMVYRILSDIHALCTQEEVIGYE